MDDATLLRRVAVEVMGWHPAVYSTCIDLGDYQDENGTYCVGFQFTWNDAGRAVERMRNDGWVWEIRLTSCKDNASTVYIKMWHSEDGDEVKCEADTMPRAVFLAALKAAEVKP